MKYYLGQIDERHGEFECSITIMFKHKGTKEQGGNFHDIIARTWYGEDGKDYADEHFEDIYWNGDMTYTVGDFHEISKATFEELSEKRVFADLSDDPLSLEIEKKEKAAEL